MTMPPRLRIMQVVLSLSPGGTERLVIEICRRLRPEIDSVVCCLDKPGEWADELTSEGIPVHALSRMPGFHPSLGRQIAKLAARYDVDALHCHHYSPYVYGLVATMLMRGVGLVFTEHGRLSDQPPSGKRRCVNPLLQRLPGDIFAVSADLKRHMVAEGFSEPRVGVIHNGIDVGPAATADDRVRARRDLGLDDDHFVIGSIGRLDTVKDFGSLIAAFAAVRAGRSNWRLVLIGSGAEEWPLRDVARAHGVEHAVVFAGFQSDARRMLAAFDLFANSSTHEGISLTILEAMASELAVVATRVGGNPETVDESATGLLVSPRSPRDLADALAALAASPEQRRAMGRAGRLRVKQHFTIERMLDSYLTAYRRQARTGADAAVAM
jgi:glycosyltransferase involved in cell wall biosynthesis